MPGGKFREIFFGKEENMFELGSFLGLIVGSIITFVIIHSRSAEGSFSIEPYSDEDQEFYSVKVSLPANEKLLKKNKIILTKHSHK